MEGKIMNVLRTLADQWAQTLWAVSWQVSVLVVLVWVISLASRKASPNFRYWLWCIVLVRLCLPVNLTLPIGAEHHVRQGIRIVAAAVIKKPAARIISGHIQSMPAASDQNMKPADRVSISGSAAASQALNSVASGHRLTIGTSIGLSWFVLVTIFGGSILWRSLRISKWLKTCPTIQRSDLVALCNRLCSEIGMKRPVQLRCMDIEKADSPAVIGILRPRIFLPRHIVDQWSLNEIEPILLHELAHIRRYDLLVNLLQMIVQVVYFFHPLVWLTNSKVRQLREEICDDIAIQHIGAERKRYSKSILRVMEESRREPAFGFAAIGFLERKNSLRRRITRIMSDRYRINPRMTFFSILALVLTSLVCIVLASEKKTQAEETSTQIKDETTSVKILDFEWKATFSNGVGVELLGVCEHPSEGKQWWHPDGSPLEQAPYHTIGTMLTTDKDLKAFEFAFRFNGPIDAEVFILPGQAMATSITFVPFNKDGKSIHTLRAIAGDFLKEVNVTDLRLGVPSGDWKTLVSHRTDAKKASYEFGKKRVEFHDLYKEEETTALVLIHTFFEPTARVIAIGTDGNEHLAKFGYVGVPGMVTPTYEFSIPLSRIKEFQFQTRPFEWIIFRNVSLQAIKQPDLPMRRAAQANRFEGKLEFNKPIMLNLQAGPAEGQNAIELQWIEFERSKDLVRAILHLKTTNIADAFWLVTVEMLDEAANVSRKGEAIFQTEKIEGGGHVTGETVASVCKGPWDEVSKATRFTISIEKVSADELKAMKENANRDSPRRSLGSSDSDAPELAELKGRSTRDPSNAADVDISNPRAVWNKVFAVNRIWLDPHPQHLSYTLYMGKPAPGNEKQYVNKVWVEGDENLRWEMTSHVDKPGGTKTPENYRLICSGGKELYLEPENLRMWGLLGTEGVHDFRQGITFQTGLHYIVRNELPDNARIVETQETGSGKIVVLEFHAHEISYSVALGLRKSYLAGGFFAGGGLRIRFHIRVPEFVPILEEAFVNDEQKLCEVEFGPEFFQFDTERAPETLRCRSTHAMFKEDPSVIEAHFQRVDSIWLLKEASSFRDGKVVAIMRIADISTDHIPSTLFELPKDISVEEADYQRNSEVRSGYERANSDLFKIEMAVKLYFKEKKRYTADPSSLTTPIAYVFSEIPLDPFDKQQSPLRLKLNEKGNKWKAYSVGPDKTDNHALILYDPTNGIVSRGDIIKTGPSSDDFDW
jgi:beta-lactamase regulating signal transducer with metallopeptidase domain